MSFDRGKSGSQYSPNKLLTQNVLAFTMQAPTSHGAIPKIRSPPHESVDKSLENDDEIQLTKNKEMGSNLTPHKDKVHSTHRHHKENQSVPTPTEEVVMHKDRPPSERTRHAEGTNENAKRESREPKSASQKDRPHSERKHQGVILYDELIVKRSSVDREAKPPPQKVRPHTERKHQVDKREDSSLSPNDTEDKDSRHARHKAKSGRKHHGDKHDDKVLSPKSSDTNVNKEFTDPTTNSPKERSQTERKKDSDALKSSQSNASKDKRKNKPSSVYTSSKIDNGNHTQKYEGLPLAPNENEKSKTRSISNKERDCSDHKHKKMVCDPGYGQNQEHGKITESNHDISLIFPAENGNKSVMRIVVRSFASSTKSQNCVDVKIEGEKFNSSNMRNPDIEQLIRELTKYVILIQKKLENADGSEKAQKDQHKSVEVVELYRRPDKTFGKKEVDKPTKSRVELGISLKFIPSGTDKESKLVQETDKKQEHSKPNPTSDSNDNNKRSLQANENGEVDKTGKRKKDKKESSRYKKGVEQEGGMAVEDGKEANEESSGQEDVHGQRTNEKRDSNLESERSEGVDVNSRDKKDTKKRGNKKYHGKKEVGDETNNITQEEDETRESKPGSGQSDGDNLGVHKKKSKRKRTSDESPVREDVVAKSENIPEGEDQKRGLNSDAGKPGEARAIPKDKRDTKNIDQVNPKKPKTKCTTETTCHSTDKKDAIQKTSGSNEGSQVPKSTTGTKHDSKKHVEKKLSMSGMKSSVSKMLVKLTASKTVVAEGLTAAIRQKHKALEASEKKKSRAKVVERFSSSKGVQIPVVFEELEPTLQSKSSVKILLEHSTEEGNLCLNLVGIRNDETQDFGGRIQFSQSGKYPKKKCEDVETMKELLTNCVKKVENVLNNLYQEPNDQSKQSKKVTLPTNDRLGIEEVQEQKKFEGIMKKPSSSSIAAWQMNEDTNPLSDSNKSLGSSSSKRRISFKEDPIELPFLGMRADSEISDDECSGGPTGECNECEVDEEDAQHTKEKDVSDILEAKLDAGEFDREARKSFERELFSSSLKDPDALERYKRKSHSALNLDTTEAETDLENDVPDNTSKAPNQESNVPLVPLWLKNNDSENNEGIHTYNSKTNLAISLSTEDKQTTTMLGISTFPENKILSETTKPSSDAASINQSIYKEPSSSVYTMMTELGTVSLESNAQSNGINLTPNSSIYATKSPMVMVSSATTHPNFDDTFFATSTNQMTNKEPSNDEPSINQSTTKEPSIDASSINQLTTKQPSPDASSINQLTTKEPSSDASSINQLTNKEPSTDASSINQSTTKEPLTDASSINQLTTKEFSTDATSINQSTTNECSTDALSINQLTTKESSTDATSINRLISKGSSPSIDSMMINAETQSERSGQSTVVNLTPKSSICETKSANVMVQLSCTTSRPIFTDSSGGEEMRSNKKGCCQLL